MNKTICQQCTNIFINRISSINNLTACFSYSAPVSSAPPDPKVTALAQQLDKLDNDLANTEESMLSRLRAPLSRTDPSGDLAKRMKEQEVRRRNTDTFSEQKIHWRSNQSHSSPLC